MLIVLIFKIGHFVDRWCPQLAIEAKYIDTLIKLFLLLVTDELNIFLN